jgi:hypothetical protein
MDAGSGINLIYAKTLRAMHISLEFLKPTDCSFHGIVPGSANYPLGRIALNVCFRNQQNYRREKLDFEVMDWPSQYHAILGRPTFSRFMAVSHYTYLVLKMPGPNGIISTNKPAIGGTLVGTYVHPHDPERTQPPPSQNGDDVEGGRLRSRPGHPRRCGFPENFAASRAHT